MKQGKEPGLLCFRLAPRNLTVVCQMQAAKFLGFFTDTELKKKDLGKNPTHSCRARAAFLIFPLDLPPYSVLPPSLPLQQYPH